MKIDFGQANWKFLLASYAGLLLSILCTILFMNNVIHNPFIIKYDPGVVAVNDFIPIFIWFLIVSWFIKHWPDLILCCLFSAQACFMFGYGLSENGPKVTPFCFEIFGGFYTLIFCVTILPMLFTCSMTIIKVARKIVKSL
jgi:hypothetical protein